MPRPVILAADDSVTVRKLIEISLKKEEFDLHFAIDGKQCLAKAAELKPALLLLDFILPDMKGIDICHALLGKPQTRDIPVLLISGNGAAIRQTYENAGNVADYLTKPFAPNVLSAVVGHLLAKGGRKNAAEADTVMLSAASETRSPATEAVSEKLRARVLQSITNALQGPLLAFPGLEAARENAPAAEYFLNFLSSSGSVDRLCQSLIALPDFKTAPAQLRCPSELISLDRVLIHLNETRAAGLLRVELTDEIVHIYLEAGEIVFITSNNPKRYCAGANFPFRSLMQPVIAAAVAQQQKSFTPFFVALQQQHQLPAGTELAPLLLAQGASALARAIKASSAAFTLEAASPLPPQFATLRQRHPLSGLLLAAYRHTDDWLTIEAAISGFDTVFQRAAETRYRPGELKLDSYENELLSMMDGSRSVQNLVEWSRLRPFDLCRRIFPLVRLGLVVPAKSAPARPAKPSHHAAETDQVNGNGRATPRFTSQSFA